MFLNLKKPRIFGLLSNKAGSNHWWNQRLTSIALIPLNILFLYTFCGVIDGTYEQVLLTYQNPFNFIVAILFLVITAIHLRQGLEVIIEDYIHTKLMKDTLLLASRIFCWGLIICSVFALGKIAFSF